MMRREIRREPLEEERLGLGLGFRFCAGADVLQQDAQTVLCQARKT